LRRFLTYVKEKLEEKAIEVSHYLNLVGYLHTYRLIGYGINFSLLFVGREHTLTLSYSAKKKRWTPNAVNEWVVDVVIPLLQPLLSGTATSANRQETKAITPGDVHNAFSPKIHFVEALACLSILDPFREENIDFSIICDFAQRGIRLILHDHRCAHLDQLLLREVLGQPSQSDFYTAKEYLKRCLTACGVIEN